MFLKEKFTAFTPRALFGLPELNTLFELTFYLENQNTMLNYRNNNFKNLLTFSTENPLAPFS